MKPIRDLGTGGETLALSGLLSFAIALLHVAMVPIGAPAYRFFTAPPELVRLAERGSALPAVVTLAIAAVFAVWGLYGLSGAGLMRRLPLLRTAIAAIAGIYTLRGLFLIPQIFGGAGPRRSLAFSGVSLTIGVAYWIGLRRSWQRLRIGTPATGAGRRG